MKYEAENHLIRSEHFIIAEKNGKLGILFQTCEQELDLEFLFFKMFDDYTELYDTIKLFRSPQDKNKYCYIGTSERKYHCVKVTIVDADISMMEVGHIEKKEIKVTDNPIECWMYLQTTLCSDLILGVSGSNVTNLVQGQVFVFGSNREGQHLGGAAKTALDHFGAELGIGKGRSGQSYALPTMDGSIKILKNEIHDFMRFANENPMQDFVLTKVGCGASTWNDDLVCQLFAGEPNWTSKNILKPMEWCLVEHADITRPTVSFNIAGRHTLDEWIGTLAVLYALHKKINLNFETDAIVIASDNADNLCKELVSRFNMRGEGKGQIKHLCETHSNLYLMSIFHDQYEQWYENFLQKDLISLCSNIEADTTINPPKLICDLVNAILRNHSCTKVYNPFAGLGILSSFSTGYTHQEPASDYSLLARMLQDISPNGNIFLTGDFNSDWLADGHDAVVCIPPICYENEIHSFVTTDEKTAILRRYRQTLKLLFHKLTIPCDTLRTAIVFVSEDFLYSDEFERYRKVLCDLGILRNVIKFSKGTFSDMKTGGAIIVLDYTQKRDSVIFTEDVWLSDLELFSDFIEDAFEIFEDDPQSFSIQYSTIANSHYCLMDKFYSYASNIHRVDAPIHIERDEYDLIPLKDLVSPVTAEDTDCIDKTLISTDIEDYSFRYVNIISSETHKEYLKGRRRRKGFNAFEEAVGHNIYMPDKLFPAGTLFISHLGMIYNSSEEGVVCNVGDYPESVAFLPAEDKIDPHYLIATLSSNTLSIGAGFESMLKCLYDNYTESFNDILSYVLNWCIPVPKNGLEAQREIVDSLKKKLPASVEKTYEILAVGDIDHEELKKRSLNVIDGGRHTEFSKEVLAELRKVLNGNHAPDAVVINYAFGEKGIERVLRQTDTSKIPLYILQTDGDELSDDYLDDDQIAYFEDNRLHCNISILIDCLRKELDYKNSPEAMIRNEYVTEFKAANAVQDAFKPKFDIAKEMELILVETRKKDSRLAERSFDFFRNIRDLILEELVRRDVLPKLDKGALASLITDKVYEHKSGNETVKYYMTGFLMPNNLSAGLQYLTFVSNEAVHNSNGEKDTAMSAVHILFQLLIWAQGKIDEGFFETKHSGDFFVKKADLVLEKNSFKKETHHTVKVTKKDNKSYFYTGNVHISDPKDLQPGETIYFEPEKLLFENEPLITEELQIYLLIKNWSREKPQ